MNHDGRFIVAAPPARLQSSLPALLEGHMTLPLQAQVLVVGAGPVGLALATDLAQRGISVLVAEIRHRGEPPNVKCNHVSARSMEIFRRLGVAKALRDTGLPADYPNDVAYRTTF